MVGCKAERGECYGYNMGTLWIEMIAEKGVEQGISGKYVSRALRKGRDKMNLKLE